MGYPPPAMKPAIRFLCAIAIACVCLAAKWNVWLGDFNSDDWIQVMEGRDFVENGLSAARVYYTRVLAPNEYRPFPPLVGAIDYAAWEYDPAGWHATNLVLHVLCSWLVLEFALALSAPAPVAAAAAIVFAAMPGTAPSAFNISSRYNILSVIFLVASLLAGVRARDGRPWLWPAAALSCAISVLCKEVGYVIPVLAALVLGRKESPREALRWAPAALAAYAGPVIVLAWVRARVAGAVPAFESHWYSDARVWIALHEAGVATVRELFVPGWEALFPGAAGGAGAVAALKASLDANNVLVCVALTVAYGALTLWAMRRAPLAALGLLWIAVTTVPILGQIKHVAAMSGAVPRGEEVFSANRLYHPAVGGALVLASVLAAETTRRRRMAAAVVVGLVATVYGAASRAEVMRLVRATWASTHCRDAPARTREPIPAGAYVLFSGVGTPCQLPFVMRFVDDGEPPAGWAVLEEEGALIRPPGLPSVALGGERRVSDSALLAEIGSAPVLGVRPTASCGSLCLTLDSAPLPDLRARLGAWRCEGETVQVSKLDNWRCAAEREARRAARQGRSGGTP